MKQAAYSNIGMHRMLSMCECVSERSMNAREHDISTRSDVPTATPDGAAWLGSCLFACGLGLGSADRMRDGETARET